MKTAALVLTMVANAAFAAEPAVNEGDFVLKNFRFASGETLPLTMRPFINTCRKIVSARPALAVITPPLISL